MFYNLYFPTVGKLLLTDMLRAACHIFLALSTPCPKRVDSSDREQWRVQLCRCFGWHTAGSVPLFFGRVKPLLIVVTKSSGAGFSAAPDGTGFPTVGKFARFVHHASPE
jgi:hypothetical protein